MGGSHEMEERGANMRRPISYQHTHWLAGLVKGSWYMLICCVLALAPLICESWSFAFPSVVCHVSPTPRVHNLETVQGRD